MDRAEGKNGARILFVDDEATLARVFCRLFSISGLEVDTASNGLEAIETFRRGVHDLVITDLVMPELSGVETIKRLLTVDPGLPIIALSGGTPCAGGSCDLDSALVAGARRGFNKPVEFDVLVAAVHELLAEG